MLLSAGHGLSAKKIIVHPLKGGEYIIFPFRRKKKANDITRKYKVINHYEHASELSPALKSRHVKDLPIIIKDSVVIGIIAGIIGNIPKTVLACKTQGDGSIVSNERHG